MHEKEKILSYQKRFILVHHPISCILSHRLCYPSTSRYFFSNTFHESRRPKERIEITFDDLQSNLKRYLYMLFMWKF